MPSIHYAKILQRMNTYSHYFARQCKHLALFHEVLKLQMIVGTFFFNLSKSYIWRHLHYNIHAYSQLCLLYLQMASNRQSFISLTDYLLLINTCPRNKNFNVYLGQNIIKMGNKVWEFHTIGQELLAWFFAISSVMFLTE